MRKQILILIFICLATAAHAELQINEVLVNEPGGFTSLEWIELYNNSESYVNLVDYKIVYKEDTISLPDHFLAPDLYFILCKKLYAASSGTSFESYWGNNSGIWGDDPFEQQIAEPFEISITLSNQGGVLQLRKNGNELSYLFWPSAGDDGYSWERKNAAIITAVQSVSKNYSTPGYHNSISLSQRDLSIDSVFIHLDNNIPKYNFSITNRGVNSFLAGVVSLYDSSHIYIESVYLPSLMSEETVIVEYEPKNMSQALYQFLYAVIDLSPPDDRAENDTISLMGVGASYPPLLITEFIANPEYLNWSEWIELYNRSDEIIDLADWQIGDESGLNLISGSSYLLEPGAYIVLVQSIYDYDMRFPGRDFPVIEPDSWAQLNNSSDVVRLVDPFGIEADRFEYYSVFSNNYTWSRKNQQPNSSWGRSSDKYGTPGKDNILFLESENSQLKLSVSSKYISPDNDGYQDEIEIVVEMPDASEYTIKIYNKFGRIVKTFYDNEPVISSYITWNGMSDDGERLPIGIYIIYAEAANFSHAKETIVIAR